MATPTYPLTLNGPVESALRVLALLQAAQPRALDTRRLVLLDYLVVHSGDVPSGPASLHPPSPFRSGEVAVRGSTVNAGLHLLASRGLITQLMESTGIAYRVLPSASVLLDQLRSPYLRTLRQRAHWACGEYADADATQLEHVFQSRIGRWTPEFLIAAGDDAQ